MNLRVKLTLIKVFIIFIFFGSNMNAQSTLQDVHEWGTFTTVQNSTGTRLAGLKGEKLPDFVYDMKLYSANGIEIKNSEIQMETPVLYFYADKQLDVKINVQFKNGIINQWFPNRMTGQNVTSNLVVDLSLPSKGYNEWDITVLDKKARPKLIEDPNIVTQEYTTPRNTSSNYIQGQNSEFEKFIFYRGLANFETPFKVEFNQKNNLVIENKFASPLSYVLVYDNSPNRQPTIWWSGAIKSGEKKVIADPAKDSEFSEVNTEINRFRDQLVEGGLFRDEADAMLNTWFEAYFVNVTDVEGLRVFWITPSSFVDEILPLTISPSPLRSKRVFVGRSELLKKSFEDELSTLSLDEIKSKYKDHRYLDVFLNGKNKGFPKQWTAFNENVINSIVDNKKSNLSIKLMPNPITESFILQFRLDNSSPLQVSIIDINGKVVDQWIENSPSLVFNKNYSLKGLALGTYILQTVQKGMVNSLRFVKQ
ncbi:MAG: T9SS type A sorting domain-containing protein [Saprospiraceae bacterium]